MAIDKLSAIVAVILALSVAAERLVEIFKGLVPHLNRHDPTANPKGIQERHRRVVLHVLTIGASIGLAFPAVEVIPKELILNRHDPWAVVALGLLASGGSGLWNSALSYMEKVKKVRDDLQKSVQGAGAAPSESRGGPGSGSPPDSGVGRTGTGP